MWFCRPTVNTFTVAESSCTGGHWRKIVQFLFGLEVNCDDSFCSVDTLDVHANPISRPIVAFELLRRFPAIVQFLGRGLNNDFASNPLCENDPDLQTPGSESAEKCSLLKGNDSQNFSDLKNQVDEKAERASGLSIISPWYITAPCGKHLIKKKIPQSSIKAAFYSQIALIAGCMSQNHAEKWWRYKKSELSQQEAQKRSVNILQDSTLKLNS